MGVGLAIFIAAFSYYFTLWRLVPMNGAARRAAPGQFTNLSDGVTHFHWHGPKDGPVIVLVHGLTTPSFVWDGVAPELSAAGYRVLTYDLFGRGYSDRPRKANSAAFFGVQLDELLRDQRVTDPFVLMGYSMGGPIVSAFAAQYPGRLKGLVLLASAGLDYAPPLLSRLARRVPIFGDWAMTIFGTFLFRPKALNKAAEGCPLPDFGNRQAKEAISRGFMRSVLSSERHLLSKSFGPVHAELAGHNIPTLAIWAGDDRVIPVSSRDTLSAINPAIEMVTLFGENHAVGYMNAPAVVAEVLGFLKK